MKSVFAVLALSLALSGCHEAIQTTSGREYLAQYGSVPVAPGVMVPSSSNPSQYVEVKSIDQRVREIAAVEPVLKFPARIGLARIADGAITPIPAEEGDSWEKARVKLGEGFGEFVPVSPMVAGMVESSTPSRYEDQVTSVINRIRLGAARQHLDAVLVYEVLSKRESSRKNVLAAANVSIIGGYILPSTSHDAEGLGNALLIDVVQGYPYGTLTTTVAKKSRVSSSWGWGTDGGDELELSNKIKAQAASQLADDSVKMFGDLRLQLAEKREKK